jgi:hypothetical protein
MYISEPAAPAARMRIALPVRVVLLLTTVGIFWLGIIPGSVMRVIAEVSAAIFPGG